MQMKYLVVTSGMQYTKFSYHDRGAICITTRYIYHDMHLWSEITMKHTANLVFSDIITCRAH